MVAFIFVAFILGWLIRELGRWIDEIWRNTHDDGGR